MRYDVSVFDSSGNSLPCLYRVFASHVEAVRYRTIMLGIGHDARIDSYAVAE